MDAPYKYRHLYNNGLCLWLIFILTGRFLEFSSTIVFVVLLILMGKGYTITRGRIRKIGVIKIVVFSIIYCGVTVSMFIWEATVSTPVPKTIYRRNIVSVIYNPLSVGAKWMSAGKHDCSYWPSLEAMAVWLFTHKCPAAKFILNMSANLFSSICPWSETAWAKHSISTYRRQAAQ